MNVPKIKIFLNFLRILLLLPLRPRRLLENFSKDFGLAGEQDLSLSILPSTMQMSTCSVWLSKCTDWGALFTKQPTNILWNVMPLLGDFGGKVGIYRFLQSPTIPRMLPSHFICRDFFSFCPFNHVPERLQARGLVRGIAMSKNISL